MAGASELELKRRTLKNEEPELYDLIFAMGMCGAAGDLGDTFGGNEPGFANKCYAYSNRVWEARVKEQRRA